MSAFFFALPTFIEKDKWLVNISIPIHFRYHQAKSASMGQLRDLVHISHPSVHLLCDIEENSDCSLYTQLEPCPPDGYSTCDWLPINTFSVSIFDEVL